MLVVGQDGVLHVHTVHVHVVTLLSAHASIVGEETGVGVPWGRHLVQAAVGW